jgi:hypothetical protein
LESAIAARLEGGEMMIDDCRMKKGGRPAALRFLLPFTG